jgi:DNA-binding LytR/AlgR family response regulator
LNEIACFYSEQKFTYVQTSTGKKYLVEKSLDKIETSLPGELFFRVNRKCIVHRLAAAGFKRMNDGKLEVLSHVVIPGAQALSVSRIRAADFKKWFHETE